MATVRQTLALNDRVSPVLSKIIKAMHSTLNVMEQVNVASERGISAAAFRQARTEINAANTALQETLNTTKKIDDNAKKAVNGFHGWRATIVATEQAIQLVQRGIHGINQVTSFFDGLTGISSRLNLITKDQLGLQEKIFAAAQRSRGEYTAMASSVAKLNLLAADAFAPFGGEDATVRFAETLNKAFVLSGASTQERNSAMYQMTQALSSGRLQGDEYRSIIENAPLVAKHIEEYMRQVKGAQGTMKDWSSEGLLTSDVIIAAVQRASEEIDSSFAKMPMKFSDHMTRLKNEAIWSLQPIQARFEGLMQSEKFGSFIDNVILWIQAGVAWLDRFLERVEQIGNSSGFQQFASSMGVVLRVVATVLGWIINLTLSIVQAIMWSWPIIEPILWGTVAALIALKAPLLAQAYYWVLNTILIPAYTAVVTILKVAYARLTGTTYTLTAAQAAYNAVLYVSPITWIILLIIALVAAFFLVIGVIEKLTGTTISGLGIILGALSVAGAFIWDLFLSILDLVLGVINSLVNQVLLFVNFFGNVFNDPIGAVVHLFGDMGDNILGIIESIAKAIDKIIGSNLAGAVSGWRNNLGSFVDTAAKKYGNGEYEKIVSSLNLSSESLGLKRWAYTDAWDFGYSAGETVGQSFDSLVDQVFGGFDPTQGPGGFNPEEYTDGNGFNVNADGSEVSLSDDDITYLRDLAKLEYVNQYTTLRPVVQAQFGDVHETADVNAIITVLEDAIEGAYVSSLGKG